VKGTLSANSRATPRSPSARAVEAMRNSGHRALTAIGWLGAVALRLVKTHVNRDMISLGALDRAWLVVIACQTGPVTRSSRYADGKVGGKAGAALFVCTDSATRGASE
jgi:hypothetical protein